jgi:hypothetical protein
MYSYLFEGFVAENQDIDFNSPQLWIIHSDKTPPHIGISQNFKFYSLKASGKDNGLSTSDAFSLFQKKNIELILVGLDSSAIKKDLAQVYSNYSKAIPFKSSCTSPILECLKIGESMLLFDLLNYLKSNSLINSVSVYNFQREILGLGMYNEQDVALEIEKLQGVKRNKN